MSAVRELALRAKEAARRLAVLSTDEKNALLLAMADQLVARRDEILEANRKDVEAGKAGSRERGKVVARMPEPGMVGA